MMPFDLSVAGDAFQYKLDTTFSNQNFYTGIDDMITWGEEEKGLTMMNISLIFAGHETAHLEIRLT